MVFGLAIGLAYRHVSGLGFGLASGLALVLRGLAAGPDDRQPRGRLRSLVRYLAGAAVAMLASPPVSGLAVGLAYAPVDGPSALTHWVDELVSLSGGFGFRIASGLAFGLALWLAGSNSEPSYADLRLRGRGTRSLARGLAAGPTMGFAAGLTFGLAAGLSPELTLGYAAHPGPANVLGTGLLAGLVFGLAAWVKTPQATDVVHDPLDSLRRDRQLTYLQTLGFGLAGGLNLGLAVWLSSCSGTYLITVTYLSIRRRTPLRLMSFLQDAHRLGLLRRTGAVYQFRHAELQKRLASKKAAELPAGDGGTSRTWWQRIDAVLRVAATVALVAALGLLWVVASESSLVHDTTELITSAASFISALAAWLSMRVAKRSADQADATGSQLDFAGLQMLRHRLGMVRDRATWLGWDVARMRRELPDRALDRFPTEVERPVRELCDHARTIILDLHHARLLKTEDLDEADTVIAGLSDDLDNATAATNALVLRHNLEDIQEGLDRVVNTFSLLRAKI
jgi:hypothetical protein